jgi:methionine-rich copper-binding protein CopC
MRRKTPLALALLGGALLAVALVAQVSAHAEYDHSTPADGETLTTVPTQVDAYFDNDIENQAGSYDLNVTNESNADVDNNDVTLDPADHAHLTVTLQPDLANGTYTVAWTTVAAEDGDEADGTFSFTIDAQQAGETPTATQPAATSAAPTATTAADELPSSGTGGAYGNGSGAGTAVTLGLASAGAALLLLGAAAFVRRERRES